MFTFLFYFQKLNQNREREDRVEYQFVMSSNFKTEKKYTASYNHHQTLTALWYDKREGEREGALNNIQDSK